MAKKQVEGEGDERVVKTEEEKRKTSRERKRKMSCEGGRERWRLLYLCLFHFFNIFYNKERETR